MIEAIEIFQKTLMRPGHGNGFYRLHKILFKIMLTSEFPNALQLFILLLQRTAKVGNKLILSQCAVQPYAEPDFNGMHQNASLLAFRAFFMPV